jgi:hypothetical protein
MSVIGIKLVTGEEIIAEAGQTKTGQIVVQLPVQIKLLPAQIKGAPMSVGFAPWPEYAVEGSPVILEPLHIVYQYTPDEGIVSEYNAMQSESKEQTSGPQIITG